MDETVKKTETTTATGAEPAAEETPSPAPPPAVLSNTPASYYYAKEEEKFSTGQLLDSLASEIRLPWEKIDEMLGTTMATARSWRDRIRTTSSTHFHQTIVSLQDLKSEYDVYEDLAFGKIKEGIFVAAAHPFITTGTVLGLGVVGLKRPRRFMYYNMMRLFASEEALLSRADTKVKDLRKSIDLLKLEGEKLEKRAVQAEDEMIRGRTKLRQAGKQIQSVIRSAYKIERQAAGLKDVLRELPRREASRFRSQVYNLAQEAKRERNALNKEVAKISNYGISV